MDGFHVKSESFAFKLSDADKGFYIKPEAYAFDFAIVEKQLMLRLAVRHGGENILLPFTAAMRSPAVVIRWQGRNWYNLLVSLTDSRASFVLATFDDTDVDDIFKP